MLQRFRPSQDVLVSAMSVLGPPKAINNLDAKVGRGAAAAAPPPSSSDQNLIKPCLVSGVAIRRHMLGVSDLQILSDAAHVLTDDSGGEVQVMNKVNQALSGENTPQIIDESSVMDSGSSSTYTSSELITEKGNPFVPYLLIHDITSNKGRVKEWGRGKSGSDKTITPSTSTSGTKVSSLVSTVQDFYMPQIVEMEEEGPMVPPPLPPPVQDFFAMKDAMAKQMDMDEDLDVQIVGVSNMPPNKFKTAGIHVTYSNSIPEPETDMGGQGTSGSSGSSSKDQNTSSSRLGYHKEGQVVQCIELPVQVSSDQYVTSLTPTLDGRHLVVVTSPKCLHSTISVVSGCVDVSNSNGSTADATNQTPPSSVRSTTHSDASMGSPSIESTLLASCQNSQGGCLLIYRVSTDSEMVLLDDKPLQTCVIDNIEDSICSMLMLPKDVAALSEDDDVGREALHETMDEEDGVGELEGQLVVTTHKGEVKLLRLSDCKVLAKINAPDGDRFVSTTYCTGQCANRIIELKKL